LILLEEPYDMGDTVVNPRVFWDRMLDRIITKYVYSGQYDKFSTDMQRLGFTTEQVEDLTSDDD
jgi:hypothetical protein